MKDLIGLLLVSPLLLIWLCLELFVNGMEVLSAVLFGAHKNGFLYHYYLGEEREVDVRPMEFALKEFSNLYRKAWRSFREGKYE